ncbi:MAG: Flp pilus assembly protein CpaB [Acetobacteraceae bacterium]
MSIRLIIVGLILTTAIALGMIAYQVATPQRPPQVAVPQVTAPVTVSYLATARALPAGTLAREEDFIAKPTAPDKLPLNAITDSPEARAGLRGALVRRYLDPGAPITADVVLRVRDRGFLAAVLDPGTRAASIGVDEVSGVSGLIWPGDRVDVILTQELDASTPAGRRIVSEPVLTNARVIAVDQDIARGDGTTQQTGKVARTVTLQLTPPQIDKLAVAQRLGRLSLSVRALDDGNVQRVGAQSTFSKDVTSVLGEQPGGTTVRVIQGDQRNEVTFR